MKPQLLLGQSCVVLTAKLEKEPRNRSQRRAIQSQTARALLAEAVQDRDEMRHATLSDPRDGPLTYVAENMWLWASITHRGGFVGVALSEAGQVGVDLEILQDRPNWVELAQVAWPGRAPPKDQTRFYLLWTLWEACVKCGAQNQFAEIADKTADHCVQTATSDWVEGFAGGLRYAFCIDAQTALAVVQRPV
ncbi:4'-phosphopantetheinyl transferase family protein [Ruegeria sp.]|uniref:4'-phosphopantetheinyl transferase family protein n=1 Tax=Ruegeria sp. TaxID=1879320 RepID=UPI003B5969A2